MRKHHLVVWTTLTVMLLALGGCSNISSKTVLANPQNYSSWRVLKSEPRISTFGSLIKSSGLEYTLKTAGAYTIFAPTNAAFKQLPKGTLAELTKITNRNELRSLLWHHIALYPITASSAPEQKMGDNQNVTISSNGQKLLMIDNAKIVGGPIFTHDATIYMINKVLIPSAGK
ncbi:MAG: fasciclin domain-containing protein [Phycisphaerae bacterium]